MPNNTKTPVKRSLLIKNRYLRYLTNIKDSTIKRKL